GLPPALALQLARSTVAGSGELARVSAESPATLRENVTSPGGTTPAALDVVMAPDGLEPLIGRAGAAATARSRAPATRPGRSGGRCRGENHCPRRPRPTRQPWVSERRRPDHRCRPRPDRERWLAKSVACRDRRRGRAANPAGLPNLWVQTGYPP